MKRERDEAPVISNSTDWSASHHGCSVSTITGSPLPTSYFTLLLQRSQLPVAQYKQVIQQAVANNPIVLLTGETGSGKTTQVPHYVAEMHGLDGAVVCTQPRRVAAMSVAQRVAEEVGSVLGAHVGYSVRFDNRTSASTKLAYYTDGMLLREFVVDKDLRKFGVVIVDEAHERTVDTDILLGLLKDLSARRPSLRIIIMSATLNMATFQKYFEGAPLIEVPGRVFPVDISYADTDVPPDGFAMARACANKVIGIHTRLGRGEGDILVFLPGESEISKTIAHIEEGIHGLPECLGVSVIPLYGSLGLEEQAKVFARPAPGVRKIVCSTNIAETSLTIDGVVHVVDSCFCKQSLYNPTKRVDFLLPTRVCKASAKQRAGRAGRTQRGECHRLITKSTFEGLPDQAFPEIMRCNATGVVLTILRLGYTNPYGFPFISPPSQANFLDAYMHLSFLEALDEGGALTEAGRLLSEFPTSPGAARAMVRGASLGCSVDIAMIVAMLECGAVFKAAFKDGAAAAAARTHLIHPLGDHLTLYKIFHVYIANKQSAEWCKAHFINAKAMQQAVFIFKQLSTLLDRLKIPRNTCFVRETSVFDDKLLRRALFEGYFGHTAMHSPTRPLPYTSVREQESFTLHPNSVLSRSRPKWLMYDALEVQGGEPFVRIATAVEPEWFRDVKGEFFDPTEIEGISDEMRRELQPYVR